MMRSIRFRVSAIAMFVTFIALTVAAIALLATLERSLMNEIDTTIINRASDVVDGIELSDVVDNATFPTDNETFIGVIDFIDGPPQLLVHNDFEPDLNDFLGLAEGLELGPNEPVDASFPSLDAIDGNDNMRVTLRRAVTTDDIVIVARSLDGVDRTLAEVRNFGFLAVPFLTALVGILVWALTGRALRPVEVLRREVEGISAEDLTRRVGSDQHPTELGRLSQTMDGMLDRLEAGQEQQRGFASDAAHELRSPLASMLAQLDVDAAHPGTADHEQTAKNLRTETRRLQTIVEDLLLLARSHGQNTTSHRLVDIDDILAVAIDSVSAGDIVITRPEPAGDQVRGEASHLERLITNLVSNAVRHARSHVVVSTDRSGENVRVVVDDDGSGIAPGDRERVFERFVRLDEARSRDSGGSGLGLALASEIADRHGGSIAVFDSAHGGARFEVLLPLA